MPMSPPPQVRCGHCGRDNAADAAFCGGCGAAIAARACARCGRGARHDDRFCAGCGARLDDTPPPAAGPSADQRRHLTVMFTDLADSTRLAGELDPEDMRDLYRAYQGACAEAIARQSGYLAHYMGDGVLAYFGFPEAHEDDARLAVAAGLDIVAAAERLRREFGRDDIGVRVGLHTGEVVVAEMGAGARRQENDVVGETPNIAARLQGIADRDAVVISEATRPLVDGWFELESLGAHDLKGVARPIGGHRVIGPTAATSRMDASAGRGLTPLIGRDTELEELLAAWRACGDGSGRVALVSGEPGIGKSRLAHELHERVVQSGRSSVRLRCSPYHRSSALFPVLRRLEGIVPTDLEPGARRRRLEDELRQSGLDVAEAAPLLGELMGLGDGDAAPAVTESAQRRKRRTLDALQAWIMAQGGGGPLLLVVEDAHWIDPSTLELLGRFFGPEPQRGVLLVITHRDEFVPPWAHRGYVRRLALELLPPGDVRAVVSRLTGGRPLPDAVEGEIALRAAGVPLYVEELTRTVLESGAVQERGGRLVAAGTLPERLVPTTLRESLMARLDRLADAREVAQLLAVQGRDVGADFLEAVSDLDRDELEAGLEQLVGAGLVRRRRPPSGSATFVFKHWLIRDVAYESLLRSRPPADARAHGRRAGARLVRRGRDAARGHRPAPHLGGARRARDPLPAPRRRAGQPALRHHRGDHAPDRRAGAPPRPPGGRGARQRGARHPARARRAADGDDGLQRAGRGGDLQARGRALRVDGRRDARALPRALRHVARPAPAPGVRRGDDDRAPALPTSPSAAATRRTAPPRTARSAARSSISARTSTARAVTSGRSSPPTRSAPRARASSTSCSTCWTRGRPATPTRRGRSGSRAGPPRRGR